MPPPMPAPSEGKSPESDVIVQAVVVRRDLLKTMEWPVGSVIAQACHACLAVAWEHRDDPCVAEYLAVSNLDSMHKVVKECKGEAQVRSKLGGRTLACLRELHIHHRVRCTCARSRSPRASVRGECTADRACREAR